MIKIMSAKEAVEITKSAHEEIMNKEMEECREKIKEEIRAAAFLGKNSVDIFFCKGNYHFINDFYDLLFDELIELGYACTIHKYTYTAKGNKESYTYNPHIEFHIKWEG